MSNEGVKVVATLGNAASKEHQFKRYRVMLIGVVLDSETGIAMQPIRADIRTVAADYFTVEPAGAITFWVRSEDRERSSLIIAFGAAMWKSVEMTG